MAMENVHNFAVEWNKADTVARVTLLAMVAMTMVAAAATLMFFVYTTMATIVYAAKTGESLVLLFGQQGMIVAGFGAFAWWIIRAYAKRQQEDEREEAERQAEHIASIRSARAKATIMRLKIAVGVSI
jgi:lysylphosphatidylglycerol synthetase-like protein (DUF2156 family)